jgi:hypothetical protein
MNWELCCLLSHAFDTTVCLLALLAWASHHCPSTALRVACQ